MSSYRGIEINLLPPELMPGPAVRFTPLINLTIILIAVAYIAVDAFIGWNRLQLARSDLADLEQRRRAKARVLADYDRLSNFGERVNRYGRLVAMASTDYVEMPVVLNRLAQIVPDGVFLESVTNTRAATRGGDVRLVVVLKASRKDPRLALETLEAFKADAIFADCFMPAVYYEEESLRELMEARGIDWDASGPTVPTSIAADQYAIEIHATLPRPLTGIGLPLTFDATHQFAHLASPALPAEDAAAVEQDTASPPPGVEPVEVH
jgi:hypothetical protein